VTRLDDPALVAAEYADEARLKRRARGFAGVGTAHDARVPLVAAVIAAAPSRVLEVGCGWGELAGWIAEDTGAEVIATDLSPRMVELARGNGVDARIADVQALPFEDEAFDAVVAAWMLYHVPDLDLGLSEIARVLRRGGAFFATTNSRYHLQELRDLVGSGPSPSKFTREDGRPQLLRHFASVDRIDVDGELVFDDRAQVDDYVRASIAMSPFADRLPVELDLPFRVRSGSSVFVAKKGS
jgi:SAM-dependent methyltransferase